MIPKTTQFSFLRLKPALKLLKLLSCLNTSIMQTHICIAFQGHFEGYYRPFKVHLRPLLWMRVISVANSTVNKPFYIVYLYLNDLQKLNWLKPGFTLCQNENLFFQESSMTSASFYKLCNIKIFSIVTLWHFKSPQNQTFQNIKYLTIWTGHKETFFFIFLRN